MVFSSVEFLYGFLPITICLYFLVTKKFRNLVLAAMSLLFYAWGEPIYVSIMLFSTVFDYVNGLLLEKFDESEAMRKAVLILSVVGNLAILMFFKYSDFFITNINNLFSSQISLLNLALPIGISFYTFQTMSYTIDVYRRNVPAQKNIISFCAYVTMFPQLIAGPIVRYITVNEQLNSRHENFEMFASGITKFSAGLAKKVLLANNIGMLWDNIKVIPAGELSVLNAWLGIIAFAFQIYFDFSGYSDMAIGLGRMFAFEFDENFNYPYISKSITEFWRRWHISLGTWFREYVYIPLGGNRVNTPRWLFNLLAVWFLTGFWHGASWNFVLWGLYFALILMIEKLFLMKVLEKLPRTVSHIYALFLILIGWVIFAFENSAEGIAYLKTMFALGEGGVVDTAFMYNLASYAPMLIILSLASLPVWRKLWIKYVENKCYPLVLVAVFAALILCTAYLVSSAYNPFLYFRF